MRNQSEYGGHQPTLSCRIPGGREMLSAREMSLMYSLLHEVDGIVEMPISPGEFIPVPTAVRDLQIAALNRLSNGDKLPLPPLDPMNTVEHVSDIKGVSRAEADAMPSAPSTVRIKGVEQRKRGPQQFGGGAAELNFRSPTREEMSGAAELLKVLSNLRVKDGEVEMPGLQGDFFPVPPALAEFLISLLEREASGEAVPFPPEDPLISTKQAANIIGFTYLEMDEKLANGDLPFEPNGPDRLLVRAEVMEFDRQCTASELDAIQEMIRATEECGAYDL